MFNKSILKFVAAFAILAIVLIFLGVNYVPRIYAQSSNQAKIVDNVIQLRPDYVNENYQRAIVLQRFNSGADFLNHHPYDVSQKMNYDASDFLNHHPFDISQKSVYTASDFLNHHPYDVSQKSIYTTSDFLNHHPWDTTK